MTNTSDVQARAFAAPPNEGGAQQAPFSFNPRAALYRAGSVLAPGLTGRIATRMFSRSRTGRPRGDYPVPLGARRFDIDDADVQAGYLWPAEGPTVFLIHGWSADSASMLGFVRPLLKEGFQVATFDAPGHGASRGPTTTMSRFVQAGVQAVRALGNVQFLVGHSLGAIAAAAVAARVREEQGVRIRAIGMVAAPTSLSNVLEIWASAEGQQLPRGTRDLIYAHLHRDNGVPVSHWDIPALSRGAQIPTVVLHDQADPVVPFSCAEHLRAQLGAVLERTAGYGHSRILASAEAKAVIVDFLMTHNAPSQPEEKVETDV
ncbi:MAG: alpha/beta fold hydrolase [Ramlibacter sp.]|nr:alpha/beta fold hydrolase [Ramlibacter sp.]